MVYNRLRSKPMNLLKAYAMVVKEILKTLGSWSNKDGSESRVLKALACFCLTVPLWHLLVEIVGPPHKAGIVLIVIGSLSVLALPLGPILLFLSTRDIPARLISFCLTFIFLEFVLQIKGIQSNTSLFLLAYCSLLVCFWRLARVEKRSVRHMLPARLFLVLAFLFKGLVEVCARANLEFGFNSVFSTLAYLCFAGFLVFMGIGLLLQAYLHSKSAVVAERESGSWINRGL